MITRLAVLAVVLATAGCSSGPGDLSGTVRYRGQPVVYGTVVVIGADGLPHHGTIQPDGRYAVTGISAGSAVVCVTSPPPTGDDASSSARPHVTDAMRDERDGDTRSPAASTDVQKNWQGIPHRYADPTQSNLRVVIKPGVNTWDIPLD